MALWHDALGGHIEIAQLPTLRVHEHIEIDPLRIAILHLGKARLLIDHCLAQRCRPRRLILEVGILKIRRARHVARIDRPDHGRRVAGARVRGRRWCRGVLSWLRTRSERYGCDEKIASVHGTPPERTAWRNSAAHAILCGLAQWKRRTLHAADKCLHFAL